ncbi:MAG: thioesterase [Acidimicrobiales bacterium]
MSTQLRIGTGVNRITGVSEEMFSARVDSMERDRCPQVPIPQVGRRFSVSLPVRLGDVDSSGRFRLDALTRYTQDVSNDDTSDAALADDLAWVVRRTTVDVFAPASFQEVLTYTTFCSGLGRRWAERRIAVHGESGAHYEVATLWVHIDPTTGRPKQLSSQFVEIYGEAAGGREVAAKLVHGPVPDGVERRQWPLRVVDFDVFNHVNNASYWSVVEEVLSEQQPPVAVPYRATIEYGAGIPPLSEVEVDVSRTSDGFDAWWIVDGKHPASVSVYELAGQARA